MHASVPMNRRRFLIGGVSLLPTIVTAAKSAASYDPPTASVRAKMSETVRVFMKTYEVPGCGIAICHESDLLYEEAFGFADLETRTALTPENRFRIASVTKPITAVAIFKLIEQGKLKLTDKVFGPGAVLGDDYSSNPKDPRVTSITIDHLLTHTAGGWPNDGTDPMFHDLTLDHHALIDKTLRHRTLDNQPGAAFAYSNFGYCVLGRVIEKLTDRPYASHVEDSVFLPAGISDMAIAGNTLADRQPLEVRYYGHGTEDPYSMNVRRMDSHGGWIARPRAIARFAASIEATSQPSQLRPDSIAAMTTPSSANPEYAHGWRVNSSRNWWHTGHLPGTATLMVRTHSGFSWAALLNTRHRDDALDRELDRLVWNLARMVPWWRV
jgi:CubicO group peptidase (beta-lactamase class C family)